MGNAKGPVHAEALYAEFLRRFPGGDDPDLEAFCSQYPEHANALRLMHAIRRETQAPESADASRKKVEDDLRSYAAGFSGDSLADSGCPAAIGKYHIISSLGRGGQAEVYRAVHPTLERELVIKLCRRTVGEDPLLRESLMAEGRLLAELDHPNLARVYDLDFHENRPFLALELVQGRNLQQLARDESFSPRRAAELLARIARALGAAHRKGVTHQDLKPENIVVGEEGNPRIIDFGIARLRHAWAEDRDDSGTISGTIEYMPPEQARGETERIGPRSDIFGLGAVLYFLLVGHAPFEEDDRRAGLERAKRCDFDRSALRTHGAPRGLEKICLKAMEAEPGDRQATADDLAADLEAYLRRPRLAAAVALLAGLAVLLSLGLLRWHPWAPEDDAVGAPGRPAEPWLSVRAQRDKEPYGRLVDLVPLKTGDRLQIHFQMPKGLVASIIWWDTKGQLNLFSPVELSSSSSTVTLRYPKPGLDVPLEGSPGTELILVLARAGKAVTVEEIKDVLGSGPWPELARDNVLLFGPQGVQTSGRRGPGALTKSNENEAALSRAEVLWSKLAASFDWAAGVAFPHTE